MPRRRLSLDEQRTTELRLAEGRGQSRGTDYQTWLTVRDFASQAPATRIPGQKSGRIHHVHSELEAAFFYLLEAEPSVLEIREQFPLLGDSNGPEETTAIAGRLGIRPPQAPQANSPVVMTTDFLVTHRGDGVEVETAFACKTSSDLEDMRTLAKLDIERHYWAARGVSWWLVTERDLPQPRATTAKELWASRPGKSVDVAPERLALLLDTLFEESLGRPGVPQREICIDVDKRWGMSVGTALSALRHAVAAGHWDVDLDQPWDPSLPLVLSSTRRSVAFRGEAS
jgi:hypothetical protein